MNLFQRPQLRLREIECLLDLFPQAALLLDLQLNHVVLANAKATELTAFTRNELMRLNITTLFPEWNGHDVRSGAASHVNGISTQVVTRNGTTTQAFVTLTRLDSPTSWVLASLIPVEMHQMRQTERQRLTRRQADLEALLRSVQEADLDRAIASALQAGHALSGADLLAVYLANPHSPGLRRVAIWGGDERLPSEISPGDLSTLLEPGQWIPGRRAASSLQRAARAAQYGYLATIPLGQAEAFNGLVVVADTNSPPAEDVLEWSRLLATTLTTILQHHTLTDNLRAAQKTQQRALAIGEAIQEVVQDGIILASLELTIREMNPSAEWTLGYATREVVGEAVDNVLIGAENLAPALQAAQRGAPTYNLGNVLLHRRDGRTFLAHLCILPVKLSNTPQAILILLRDLSEQEQFQARNQQLEQRALLGEVTAIFAHEVRNPINNLSTGLQLMALNLPADDPQREMITRMEADCNRLSQLMQSVLAFSRPVEAKTEAVDLGRLLERLLERWRPRLARVNVQHLITNHATRYLINGDPRSLEQVFTNLFSNATEAMSENGGLLVVNLRAIPTSGGREQIEVSISDNGPGIPDEIRERIFEPFFTTSRDGAGLGLAIARRIVTAHKGALSVTSVPGGTVFQVIFPAVRGQELRD